MWGRMLFRMLRDSGLRRNDGGLRRNDGGVRRNDGALGLNATRGGAFWPRPLELGRIVRLRVLCAVADSAEAEAGDCGDAQRDQQADQAG